MDVGGGGGWGGGGLVWFMTPLALWYFHTRKLTLESSKPSFVVANDNLYEKNNGLQTNKLLNEKHDRVCVCEFAALLVLFWGSCAIK